MNARSTGTLLLVTLALAAPAARAQPGGDPPTRMREAGEPPLAPRLFHVPTAWLQPPSHLFASTGANHRGSGMFAVSAGIGRLAELDLELTDRFVSCTAFCDGDDRNAEHGWVVSALFKIGVSAAQLGPARDAAAALGFRRSLRSPAGETPGDSELGLAELYVAASALLGSAHLHTGVELWDAGSPEARLTGTASIRLRPFFGLGWRPPQYPKTTLLGDFGWVPELPIAAADEELRWIGGWGVRYQALSWGSIELAVRHRQGEGIGGATVFVRLNATGSIRALLSRARK